MAPPGLEPGTLALLAPRSNQLSYKASCACCSHCRLGSWQDWILDRLYTTVQSGGFFLNVWHACVHWLPADVYTSAYVNREMRPFDPIDTAQHCQCIQSIRLVLVFNLHAPLDDKSIVRSSTHIHAHGQTPEYQTRTFNLLSTAHWLHLLLTLRSP